MHASAPGRIEAASSPHTQWLGATSLVALILFERRILPSTPVALTTGWLLPYSLGFKAWEFSASPWSASLFGLGERLLDAVRAMSNNYYCELCLLQHVSLHFFVANDTVT